MKFNVEFKDSSGAVSHRPEQLSLLGFAKHASACGRGNYDSQFRIWMRAIGIVLNNLDYFETNKFLLTKFSREPEFIEDPTSVTNFSNIVGKAVADYLAKKLFGAVHTHTYEAAMRRAGHKIKGMRPDLYCTTPTKQFSVEAKGRSYFVSDEEMKRYKLQSQSGPLSVHFTVASATCNIYEDMFCRFHDPHRRRTIQ